MASLFALPVPKVEIKSEEDDLKTGCIDLKKKPELERSKLDMEIAKYLRFNVPRKSTMMQKQAVEYFIGSKAVDVLMESKWAVRKKGEEQYFVGREDAAAFLDELLQKRFFYRVMKNEHERKKKDDKNEEKKEESDRKSQGEEQDGITEISTKLRKRKNKNIDDAEENAPDLKSSKVKGKTKNKKNNEEKPKEKVKKRYKLTYHEDQTFLDSKEIYIWVYNPVSWKTIAKGVGVMLLVAVATLFPLWPDEVRVGVYYLSVTAGSFIGSVFVVAFLRTLLFGVLWVLTGGSHHLWVLPNLLEDVGFFESFKPLYSYEYKGSKKDDDDDSDEEDKDSDEEENDRHDDEQGSQDETAAEPSKNEIATS